MIDDDAYDAGFEAGQAIAGKTGNLTLPEIRQEARIKAIEWFKASEIADEYESGFVSSYRDTATQTTGNC